jgi:transcription termination/antitermination protein NusG
MASAEIETINTGTEKLKLGAAIALLVGGLAAFYFFAKQGQWVQWGALLVGLGLAVGAFFSAEAGKRLIAFARDAWREVKKVVWPARKEAVQITAYVFVVDGQDTGVALLRLDLGVEEMMNDEVLVPAAQTTVPAAAANPDLRWYVVHAYSGMEKAVERNIQERIQRTGMQSKFGRILVPMEEVVEIKNGQKKTTERKFFPGYVLVEMVMDDDTWHLVKHTNKVTGFVGGAKNRPAPISESEVMKIVNQMQEGTEKPRHKIEFEVGEFVRVKEGPFTDFNGSVEDVNYEKSKVRVSVTIFGRSTPVELEFSQIEKT